MCFYLCFDNERNFKSSYINTASLWCIVLKNQRRLCKQLTSVLQACINISYEKRYLIVILVSRKYTLYILF